MLPCLLESRDPRSLFFRILLHLQLPFPRLFVVSLPHPLLLLPLLLENPVSPFLLQCLGPFISGFLLPGGPGFARVIYLLFSFHLHVVFEFEVLFLELLLTSSFELHLLESALVFEGDFHAKLLLFASLCSLLVFLFLVFLKHFLLFGLPALQLLDLGSLRIQLPLLLLSSLLLVEQKLQPLPFSLDLAPGVIQRGSVHVAFNQDFFDGGIANIRRFESLARALGPSSFRNRVV
mmetsp:Transcript_7885/g.14643  ORF Transcript_7885/g.14643 Transcript_7885/m.14643 type:complete len:234 (+) Transcript_7885:619-1320(+)